MKNETSANNSKHIINNSSMLTAENSSKNSKLNLKRNRIKNSYRQNYSNTAIFENPRRDLSNTNINKKSQKGIYITDVTNTKFKDTELETKTTLESTNQNYKTYNNHFLRNRNKTPKNYGKNSLPNITSNRLTKYISNPTCFTCCDRKLHPEFLIQLYNDQLANSKNAQTKEKSNKKLKKTLKEDRKEFLRKTNEIKRLKYEMDLKTEAMEEYKENIKMNKCGIEFTISNLKKYKENLENNFMTKYNDNLRKLGRELFERRLKSDMQNNELILLKKEVLSLRNLLVKKQNILKNIEKWIYLQIFIKEGEEPKNLKNALEKYNNKLIFDSLEELNNALLYKEDGNLRLMEKYNKSQNEKDKYISELLEYKKEVKNKDNSIDLMLSNKENILFQLKIRQNALNSTVSVLNSEKNIKNRRSKSLNNKILNNNFLNNVHLKKNELGILYKPIKNKNNLYEFIDCVYICVTNNDIKGIKIDINNFHQINNNGTSRNAKAVIKMKIIELYLNHLISSINKKINLDKNNLVVMEKTIKIIDLYHKKINGNRNKKMLQQNWDNLMKKISDKNKKAYYLPKGKIEKYNIVSIQKKKNEEKLKNKKIVKKIDIWDFLYDQTSEQNESNYSDKIQE